MVKRRQPKRAAAIKQKVSAGKASAKAKDVPATDPIPKDVLIHIASLLDHDTAISFALASRLCHAAAEKTLMREVYLVVDPDSGHYVPDPELEDWEGDYAQPMTDEELDSEDEDYDSEEEDGSKEDDESEEEEEYVYVPQMFRTIIDRDERKLAMVEKATVALYPGMVEPIIKALQALSPSVQSLEVLGAPQMFLAEVRQARASTCLDFRWLRSGLTFPSVTSLRLGKHSVRYVSFLPIICHSCPSLQDLDLDIDHILSETPYTVEDEIPDYPTTDLRRLRLNFVFYEDDPHECLITIRQLLENSPRVRQLALHYAAGNCEFVHCQLIHAAEDMAELEDLHWQMRFRYIGVWSEEEGFKNLKRIVSKADHWPEVMQNLPPNQPKLETIFIDAPKRPSSSQTATSLLPTQSMLPDFVDKLLESPQLHIIHFLQEPIAMNDLDTFSRFDALAARGVHTGYINSYHHGDQVLLHAHLLMNEIEVADMDRDKDGTGEDVPPGCIDESYLTRDDELRYRRWEKREEAVWVDLTDLGGKVVPVERIERMREVQGASEAEWRGRGIIVGDAAWAVLEE